MISIKVDTSEFDKTFREYMRYTSRTMSEACNQHAYYIARNACNTTKSADKEKITQDLRAASSKYPKAPLAAILVNKERKEKGKKGLNRENMRDAVEKFIRKRQSYRNFLRAGWLSAVKAIEPTVPKRNGTPIPKGMRAKGFKKGGARAALDSITNWNPIASIWNSVKGNKDGKNNEKIKSIIEEGAVAAIQQETISMREYIQRKMDEADWKLWK